jgi:hypothetical protein
MTVETPSIFTRVIEDHLALKERNAQLERSMPLGRYKIEDPFQNHPLFKSEEQARLEDTLEGEAAVPAAVGATVAWPGEDTVEQQAPELESGLWSRSRDFDWGD